MLLSQCHSYTLVIAEFEEFGDSANVQKLRDCIFLGGRIVVGCIKASCNPWRGQVWSCGAPEEEEEDEEDDDDDEEGEESWCLTS